MCPTRSSQGPVRAVPLDLPAVLQGKRIARRPSGKVGHAAGAKSRNPGTSQNRRRQVPTAKGTKGFIETFIKLPWFPRAAVLVPETSRAAPCRKHCRRSELQLRHIESARSAYLLRSSTRATLFRLTIQLHLNLYAQFLFSTAKQTRFCVDPLNCIGSTVL